jgi:hypothetical protein
MKVLEKRHDFVFIIFYQRTFYEELQRVFGLFSKYPMRILSGDYTAKLGRDDVFKPTVGNESLHQGTNGNGVRIVNFAT